MTGHIHAESMLLYAQDAMETDKPWERWQYGGDGYHEWQDLERQPGWATNTDYRRKPKTIMINGHEVPEPIARIQHWEKLYAVCLESEQLYYTLYCWPVNSPLFDRLVRLGLVHTTQEAATAHAKALLSFTKRE